MTNLCCCRPSSSARMTIIAATVCWPRRGGSQVVSGGRTEEPRRTRGSGCPGGPKGDGIRARQAPRPSHAERGNRALRCPLIPISYCQEVGMVDKNRVQGGLDKAKGAVKEGVGNLTGDEKT